MTEDKKAPPLFLHGALAMMGRNFAEHHALFRHMPLKPQSLAEGEVVVDVQLPEKFTDGPGIHGGIFTILLDTILAFSAWSRMSSFQPLATINLKTDFFEDVPPGDTLTCIAECQAISRGVAFCQGHAKRSDGVLVAQADGTFIVGGSRAKKAESRL